MTFIPMVSPRFGKHACEGYQPPATNKRREPRYPVVYRNLPKASEYINQEEPLEPYRMGQRVFDFNYDGLAHYGLIPDMLQDLKNLGDQDLDVLFRSAEGYLQMWEKVERLRGPLRGAR